jgi:plastocyanin
LNRETRSFRTTSVQRRLIVLIALSTLTLGLAACGSSSKSSSPPAVSGAAQITIDSSFTFHTTPVKAGSTVTVKNDASVTHTVTADGAGGFNVTIDGGKTATFTAPAAGTYPFHCNIHTSMHGTLTVT